MGETADQELNKVELGKEFTKNEEEAIDKLQSIQPDELKKALLETNIKIT